MVKTIHKYIYEIRVKASDTSLIIGTIHPHRTNQFIVDFFYGNRNSLWSILSTVFQQYDFESKNSIIDVLIQNKIWITDIILECERENETVTQDKHLQNLVLNDDGIRNGINNSSITTIFFTSGFGKNNAAKLFCDTFNIKPKLNNKREFIIPKNIFGRSIKGIVLFSPSGQANIGISKNKLYLEQKEKYKSFAKPISKFKIDFYKNAFILNL